MMGASRIRLSARIAQEMEFGFRFARSAMVANAMILQVIGSYKYNRAVWFEPFLGDLLTRQAAPALAGEKWDLIVPVPLHPVKERRAGVQPGRTPGAASGTGAGDSGEHAPGAPRQIHRNADLVDTIATGAPIWSGAFVPRAGKQLNGEKVILVDDVLTTGATTSACARALREVRRGRCLRLDGRARGLTTADARH